jgi:hypothetical protein
MSDAAQTEATKQHPDVKVRLEEGRLIYSCKGVDLLSRVPGGGSYVALRDFPKYQITQFVPGTSIPRGYDLSEPHDHNAACTARDMAREL